MNSFNFRLKKPVEIAKKGDVELVFELEIRAPTAQNRAQLIRLKQGYFKAIISYEEPNRQDVAHKTVEAPENPLDLMTGELIMAALYLSDVDLPALEEEFKKLLSARGAFADGVPLTSFHLDQLDFDDFEALMGEYIKVFIAPSLI
ncbi:MAG: hypothetical protein IM547_01705 [Chitinophagaceae bacterium]|nr:hypothetical protein [Chitinophagaceae bacterium]